MFRRREDSLFDNTTDTNEADSNDSVSVASQPSSAAGTPAASASAAAVSNSTQSVFGTSTNAAATPARAPEPRNSAPQPASSFRPNTPAPSPVAGDLSRSRMPESKPAAPAPAAPVATAAPLVSAAANKSGKRVLTVGNDILLKGEIATCDRLVIEGKVDATLNDVHTVEIAEGGSFKGSAQIEDAEISGLFEGDLIVRNRLVIYSTGKVRGTITYGEIEIERGGELTGEIRIGGSAPSQSSSNRARQSAPKDDKVAA